MVGRQVSPAVSVWTAKTVNDISLRRRFVCVKQCVLLKGLQPYFEVT